MRFLIISVVLPLLLTASPAFASTIFNTDQDDSVHQQAQYGQFFGIVLGGAGALIAILVTYGIMRGIARSMRGKKKAPFARRFSTRRRARKKRCSWAKGCPTGRSTTD